MMDIKDVKWEFVDEEYHATIFKEILAEKMHNTEGTAPSRSRMENIATGQRKVENGLTVLTARNHDGDLVALAFCEHMSMQYECQASYRLKNAFRSNSAFGKRNEFDLFGMGTFSVFVRPDSRGCGLAVEAIKKMEIDRSRELIANSNSKFGVLWFQAFGKSEELIKKHAVVSAVTCSEPGSRAFLGFSDMVGANVLGIAPRQAKLLKVIDLKVEKLELEWLEVRKALDNKSMRWLYKCDVLGAMSQELMERLTKEDISDCMETNSATAIQKLIILLSEHEKHASLMLKIDKKYVRRFMRDVNFANNSTSKLVEWNDIRLCIIGERSIEFTRAETLNLLKSCSIPVRSNMWNYRIKSLDDELLEIGLRDEFASIAIRVARDHMESGGVFSRKQIDRALDRVDICGHFFQENASQMIARLEAKELKERFSKKAEKATHAL